MGKKQTILVILSGIVYIACQYLLLPKVSEIDFYSVFSEGTITLTVFTVLIKLRSLRDNKSIHFYLNLGFTLLFISLLTDTSDEIFEHSLLLTTILEDISQVLGFLIVLFGISKWIKFNNEQNDELRKLATVDELTDIYNRRYFDEKALEQFNRSQRSKSSFSILMIDIDHFKSINDIYGHTRGDFVLQEFSQELKKCIRKIDIVARWGGEEFSVLLVDIDKAGSLKISEKIRKKSESLLIKVGDKAIKLTVSIGATILDDNDTSIETIIDRADKLLYEAKQNGRNCVKQDFSL